MPKRKSQQFESELQKRMRKIRDEKRKILGKLQSENPNLEISVTGSLTSSVRNDRITCESGALTDQKEIQSNLSANKFRYDVFHEIQSIPSSSIIVDVKTTVLLQNFLKKWISECHINQNHAKILLKFLNCIFPTLPIDPRTIMGTMRDVQKRLEFFSGNYLHIGLKKNIETILSRSGSIPSELSLDAFIDGFPIFKSAQKNDMWCILGRLYGLSQEIFTIGLYFGESKPGDFCYFLSTFVDEFNEISNEFQFKGQKISLKIRTFIMDSPAKSAVLGTKACHGKCGCSRCTIRGSYLNNRMSFYKSS
jgi:hypothetical protein